MRLFLKKVSISIVKYLSPCRCRSTVKGDVCCQKAVVAVKLPFVALVQFVLIDIFIFLGQNVCFLLMDLTIQRMQNVSVYSSMAGKCDVKRCTSSPFYWFRSSWKCVNINYYWLKLFYSGAVRRCSLSTRRKVLLEEEDGWTNYQWSSSGRPTQPSRSGTGQVGLQSHDRRNNRPKEKTFRLWVVFLYLIKRHI